MVKDGRKKMVTFKVQLLDATNQKISFVLYSGNGMNEKHNEVCVTSMKKDAFIALIIRLLAYVYHADKDNITEEQKKVYRNLPVVIFDNEAPDKGFPLWSRIN